MIDTQDITVKNWHMATYVAPTNLFYFGQVTKTWHDDLHVMWCTFTTDNDAHTWDVPAQRVWLFHPADARHHLGKDWCYAVNGCIPSCVPNVRHYCE